MTDRVAVLTDSSAGMPADQARRFDVHVVPIHLTIGSDEFRDGLDLDPAVLYQALQKGVPVKSAAPSPLDYADAVEATLSDDVVVVTPASEFTFMYRNASLAAELSDRRVTVVDSRSATAGHGLVVLAGAQAAAGGGTVDDVVSAAEDAASRVELVGALETLDYLRSSGRVSGSRRAWPNGWGCLGARRRRWPGSSASGERRVARMPNARPSSTRPGRTRRKSSAGVSAGRRS